MPLEGYTLLGRSYRTPIGEHAETSKSVHIACFSTDTLAPINGRKALLEGTKKSGFQHPEPISMMASWFFEEKRGRAVHVNLSYKLMSKVRRELKGSVLGTLMSKVRAESAW